MIAIASNNPILAVPGCSDKAMEPKEPIVVKALNKMAREVDDCTSVVSVSRARDRATK